MRGSILYIVVSIGEHIRHLKEYLGEGQARDRAELKQIARELADPKWAESQRLTMIRRRAYLERTIESVQIKLNTLEAEGAESPDIAPRKRFNC